ncbi:hypothetical protein Ciccas_001164, partial [Cichlidogyrus casuarinus]
KLVKSTTVLILVFSLYQIIFLPFDIVEAITPQNVSDGNNANFESAKLGYQQLLDGFQGFF